MASEPNPDPSQPTSVLCPHHGLRYDPRLSTGCVRCRRTRDEPTSSWTGPVGGVLVVMGLSALAVPLKSSLQAYFSTPTINTTDLPTSAPPEHRRCLSAEGTRQHLEAALKDCKQACQAGWGASCRRLAGLCTPDAGLPPDDACVAGVLPLLEQACLRQDAIACILLSEQRKADILWKACDSGLGSPCAELAPYCDPQRTALSDDAPTTAWAFLAHPSLRMACAGGPARLYGRGCTQGDWASCENSLAKNDISPAKFRELLEQACDQADANACRRWSAQVSATDPALASVLLDYAKELDACSGGNCSPVQSWRSRLPGDRTRIERQQAVTQEEACLKQSIVTSCWEAAEAYAQGDGVVVDAKYANELNAKARQLLKEGCGKEAGNCASPDTLQDLEKCDQGDGKACLTVAQILPSGSNDIRVIFRRGVRFLRLACDQHRGETCWVLANLQRTGSLPGGEAALVGLLTKGCDGHHGLSCNELATRIAEGQGLAQSQLEAERLFRKAAELLPTECNAGSRTACITLADLLNAGKGVPRDDAKATYYRDKGAALPTPANSP